jgi:hypothetical protein
MTKKKPAAKALTEHDAIELLHKSCSKSGQLVLPQVRNATGFSSQVRTADALVVETWPSRGQSFTGIEYKRTRADWMRELAQPAKPDEIAQFCKFWVVLAPAGLIEVGEVPEFWGLWEIKGGRIFRTKPPVATEYSDPSVSFVCAILRSNRSYEPSRMFRHLIESEVNESLAARHDAALKTERERYRDLNEKVQKFETATGLTLRWGVDRACKVGPEIVRHLAKPSDLRDTAKRHREALTRTLDSYNELLAVLGDD